MRAFLVLLLVCGIAHSISLKAHAHNGQEPRVVIELDDQHAQSAGNLVTKFQLVDTVKNVTLADTDLATMQNQKLQILIFDPALKVFQHLSANFENGMWSSEAAIPTNGNYWFWAEGVISADKTSFATNARIEVINGAPQNTTPPVLTEARSVVIDGTSIQLGNSKIVAKKTTLLSFRFSHSDKSPVKLGNILGGKAFMTIVSDDGDSINHAHVLPGNSPQDLSAQLNLADAGMYRAWVEYLEDGHLKTAEFAFEVF